MHHLRLDRPIAPGLERRRGDREVLDRETRRVKQRHCLRPGSSRRVARQHRPSSVTWARVTIPALTAAVNSPPCEACSHSSQKVRTW